ncbi:MAG: hypothetical protein QM323_09920, partial [Acidobacteriota bacterium]|nr:hypothetical protein [Acidobacteriota bacterium]
MQRIRSIRTMSIVALVVAGIIAALAILAAPSFAASPTARGTPVPKPPIVKKYIRYGTARKKQTAAYCRRHYGQRVWRLTKPKA